MKLKAIKILTKGSRNQIRNHKNKDWIGKDNIWQIVIKVLNWEQIKFL
jgi:hypothetical protein